MKVLVVDEMHPSIFTMASDLGLELDYQPNIKKEQVAASIEHYEGLIIRSKLPITEALLSKATKLQFIARAGAGLELIDVAYCAHNNIQLFTANEGNSLAVAEHILAMVLSLFNQISKADREVKQKIWLRDDNRGEQLSGKTIGIIGVGHNGTTTGNLFAAMGCKVLGYDKYKNGYGNHGINEASMDQIYVEADIISFHVPLTEDTNKLMNEVFLAKMQKPFYVCNASRGEIVPFEALCQGLKSLKIKGACLDVLENEKLQTLNTAQKLAFEYLSKHDYVLLSPHVAGWTHQSYIAINEVLIDKIKGFIGKEK